jgi:hypothetical protein
MKLSRITALTTAALALAAIAATPTLAQMKDEKTVTVGGAPISCYRFVSRSVEKCACRR